MSDRANRYAKQWYKKNSKKVIARTCAYAKAHPKQTRSYQLKHCYGINLLEYNTLLWKQNFQCAICKSPSSKGSGTFHVDHDHTTGYIRGLLCNNCNLGLGYFEDRKVYLLGAVKYLSNF